MSTVQKNFSSIEEYLPTASSFTKVMAVFSLIVAFDLMLGLSLSYDLPLLWPWVFVCLVAVVAFVRLFKTSNKPLESGFGVAGFSLTLGFMLGPILTAYVSLPFKLAVTAALATMTVVSMLGLLLPRAFSGNKFLAYGITAAITALVTYPLAGLTLWGWVGVGVFTLILIYEWRRALSVEWTWDKAIDASGGVILDLVVLPYTWTRNLLTKQ